MYPDLREYFVKSACRKSLFATCMFCRGGSKNIQQLFTISLPFVHNSLGKRGYDRNVNSTTLQISPSLFFHAEPAASPAAGFVCFGGMPPLGAQGEVARRSRDGGDQNLRNCQLTTPQSRFASQLPFTGEPLDFAPSQASPQGEPFASLARRGCFRYNGTTTNFGGHSLGQALF